MFQETAFFLLYAVCLSVCLSATLRCRGHYRLGLHVRY